MLMTAAEVLTRTSLKASSELACAWAVALGRHAFTWTLGVLDAEQGRAHYANHRLAGVEKRPGGSPRASFDAWPCGCLRLLPRGARTCGAGRHPRTGRLEALMAGLATAPPASRGSCAPFSSSPVHLAAGPQQSRRPHGRRDDWLSGRAQVRGPRSWVALRMESTSGLRRASVGEQRSPTRNHPPGPLETARMDHFPPAACTWAVTECCRSRESAVFWTPVEA